MTFYIIVVAIAINGKTPMITREKLHPFVNAKVIPVMHKANANTMVPIFSPRAF